MPFSRSLPLLLLCTALSWAGSLKVTVKDPSSAVVPDAGVKVEAASGTVVTKATGKDGVAEFPDLLAGAYQVTVQHDGFEVGQRAVEISEKNETAIEVVLKIATQQTAVEVDDKLSALANSDANYRALRGAELAESFLVENVVLKRDAGTLTLTKGTISFTAPVLGKVAVAAFHGQGSFRLVPAMKLEEDQVRRITGQSVFSDDFDSAVLLFSDGTYDELKASLKTKADAGRTGDVLRDFRHRVRRRVDIPRSMAEYLMQGDGVPNIDAELLADLYNPKFPGSFRAYIHAQKHGDLRFFVNPLGAVPELLGPEEVALVNVDMTEVQDGVLYLTHTVDEWKGAASNEENHHVVTPLHYKIETVIGKNEHLSGQALLKFEPRRDGDRIFRMDLLPTLRVSRVSMGGKDIGYIQESRRVDGAFYVVMPAPMVKGKAQEILIEYEGNKVVRSAGGGNFAVSARTSWYPSLNDFSDRCTYDLTFKVPKRYTLVGVGKLVDHGREDDYAVTHWVSEVPLAVAGFNYGDFKLKEATDESTHYNIEAYATSELPDYLRRFSEFSAMTPSRLAGDAIVDAENSIRCFTRWFGPLPYGRIAITQQPQFNFGQSWPTLVYMPLFAFLDSTQRWFMLGGNAFRFNEFIEEVAPHEVAHQWWGHLVGWSSYHDQWLSEGFADFSASLFLEMTEKKRDKYLTYWEHGRKRLLEKNNFGLSANDAGPLWMGLRLNSFRSQRAYNTVVYSKGGFTLHMLRYLMQDPKTGDEDFIAMMHDFVTTYSEKNASTEGFRTIVEKHMKPQMDLAGNQRMGWFFNQWVYGTEVPAYHLAYKLTDEADGKVMLTAKITQSGVSDLFRMRIPIYLDFGVAGGPVKATNIAVVGNSTSAEIKVKLPQRPKKVLLNYNQDVLAREASVGEM